MPNSPIVAGGQVIVLWVPVPGAVKYNVYLNGKKVGDSPSIQLMFPTPEGPGEYVVTLSAVDASGAEGEKSRPGVFKIISLDAPKGLISRVAEGKVILRWDKAQGAVIYNLYRSEKKDAEGDLLGSLQSEAYTDSAVKEGKTYYYRVSSKDAGGKESKKGEAMEVSVVKQEKAIAATRLTIKVLPAQESGRIGFVDMKPISSLADFEWDPKDKNIIAAMGSTLLRIDKEGGLVAKMGPWEGIEQLNNFAIGADGNYYVTTTRPDSQFLVISPSGDLVRKVALIKPPLDDKEVWALISESTRRQSPPAAGDIMCLKDEVWVADYRLGLIHVFSYDGKFKRYYFQFKEKDRKVRFGAVTGLKSLPDGRIVLGFALNHYAAVVDRDMNAQFLIGKQGTGYIGSFINIAGMKIAPDGSLLITDPNVNSIQAFDLKDGKYLYHLGDEKGVEDTATPGRAEINYGSMVADAQFVSDKEFLVYSAGTNAFVFMTLK